MRTLSSDKSHLAVKVGSMMKAQALASDVNTMNRATSIVGYTGSSHQLLQSRTTTLLQLDDAQSAAAWLHPAVHSVKQPSVVQLKAAAVTAGALLPHSMSSGDKADDRTVVENASNLRHSSTVAADSLTLATPMKRVESISASASDMKTSGIGAVSVKNPSRTRRLHYESNTVDGRGRDSYVAGSQFTKQLDTGSRFGLHPQVQSTVDRHCGVASKLQGTASANFRNVQPLTGDVVSQHSAVLENQAVGTVNGNAEIPSSSLTPTETVVSSQLSVAESATAADISSVDAGHVQSLQATIDGSFLSHINTRLNELWNRFSQDSTVCCPRGTDSSTAFSMSSIEQTDSGVTESHARRSDYQHAVEDESQDAKNQQSSSDELQTSNLLGRSSSATGFTANIRHAGHHNLSSKHSGISQSITEPLHSSHEAHGDWDNKSISRKPTKSVDAGKVSSLSAVMPSKHAWIVKDERLPVVPEDTTLESVSSDFMSASSVDDTANIITHTTKRHLSNDPKLLRLQQKIAQQREKHKVVRQNEQRRKEHILKMELALQERQRTVEQKSCDVQKTGDDHHSLCQSEVTESSMLLMTVTGTDSDVTSSVPHHSADSSQLLSAYDAAACCLCQQAQRRMHRVINGKENVFLPEQHKSETTFRPELREVKYTKTKATKSAPTVLSGEKISCEPERNSVAKNSRRKIITSSAFHGSRIPVTATVKNAQGDQRSHSKFIRSSKTNKLSSQSKANYSNRVLTEKSKLATREHVMQSKAVQTTPRLRDGQVFCASTAVQCPADWSHCDKLDTASRNDVKKRHYVRSLSSKIFSPDSSTDAEFLQHLKYKPSAKQHVRALLPRELFAFCQQKLLSLPINVLNAICLCFLCTLYLKIILTKFGK